MQKLQINMKTSALCLLDFLTYQLYVATNVICINLKCLLNSLGKEWWAEFTDFPVKNCATLLTHNVTVTRSKRTILRFKE